MAAPMFSGSYQLHLALLKTLQRSISTSSCLCRQRRLKIAGSDELPTKKPTSATPGRITLTIEEVQKLQANKKKLIDPPIGDKFWDRKPVDDVWFGKYYPPKHYSFQECVAMHRQTCCAAMFDNEDGIVSMNLELCMRTVKKTKFTSGYMGNVVVPHRFVLGTPKRKILALSGSAEEIEVAKSYGVEMSGGSDLIAQIQRDEIVLAEEGIDIVIATPDVLQQLLLVKDKLPGHFPSKLHMTTGFDMDTMANTYTHGIPYKSVSTKDDPTVSKLNVPIGRLNLPVEELEENWNHWRGSLNSIRQALGQVVLDARMECKPSFESFLLDMSEHNEGAVESEEAYDDEDDEDEEDEGDKAMGT